MSSPTTSSLLTDEATEPQKFSPWLLAVSMALALTFVCIAWALVIGNISIYRSFCALALWIAGGYLTSLAMRHERHSIAGWMFMTVCLLTCFETFVFIPSKEQVWLLGDDLARG